MLYVKFDDFEDVSVMGNEKDHGMFITIKDGNVYAECERCGVVERITSPCEFIASTFRSRVNFNEGYELCEKCLQEVEFVTVALRTGKLPNRELK